MLSKCPPKEVTRTTRTGSDELAAKSYYMAARMCLRSRDGLRGGRGFNNSKTKSEWHRFDWSGKCVPWHTIQRRGSP